MNLQDKNSARERENKDPTEGNRTMPVIVYMAVTAMIVWAVSYIFYNANTDAPELGDRRTLLTLMARSAGTAGGAAAGSADGGQIYSANCVACHQANGAGMPGVFPPLASSEWVLAKDKVPVNILLFGITGKLTVRGASFSGQMPAFKDKLSDDEIGAVLSYIRSNFGNSAAKIAADAVKAERDAGKDRKDPWNGDDELNKLKQ